MANIVARGTGSHCARGLSRKWQSRTLGGTLAPSRNTSTHGRASDALPARTPLLTLSLAMLYVFRPEPAIRGVQFLMSEVPL